MRSPTRIFVFKRLKKREFGIIILCNKPAFINDGHKVYVVNEETFKKLLA